MPERRIPCPECRGRGISRPMPTSKTLDEPPEPLPPCAICRGKKTMPDRRKPTANDRAVERILAEDEAQGSGRYVDHYTQGYGDGVEHCAGIIREEAERHE